MQDVVAGPESKVISFDAMPVKRSANGSEGRAVLRGTTATGDAIAVHESTQPKGAEPVALHVIEHTEVICIREGVVAFDHDGITEQAGVGDILLVAKGTRHRLRNAGEGPLSYFVVAIGGDAAPDSAAKGAKA